MINKFKFPQNFLPLLRGRLTSAVRSRSESLGASFNKGASQSIKMRIEQTIAILLEESESIEQLESKTQKFESELGLLGEKIYAKARFSYGKRLVNGKVIRKAYDAICSDGSVPILFLCL